MGPNEHRIGGQLGCANHHSEQVPAHTELLAVDAGLCRHPDRTVVEHGLRRAAAVGGWCALDDDVGLADFDDDIEWSIPGNSTISGTYRGKDKFMELLGKLAEKSFTTTPERFLADGDDVVIITRTTTGEESALQADVLTYRNGKLVKAVSFGDTALQERIFGTK